MGNLLQRARCCQGSPFQSVDHLAYVEQTRLNLCNPAAEGAYLLRDDLRLRTGSHVLGEESTVAAFRQSLLVEAWPASASRRVRRSLAVPAGVATRRAEDLDELRISRERIRRPRVGVLASPWAAQHDIRMDGKAAAETRPGEDHPEGFVAQP